MEAGNNGKKAVTPRTDPSLYFSLFEQATDAIMLTDFSGNIIDGNESFCRMFGYTKKELLRLNVDNFIPAEDLSATPIRFDLLQQGKHIFTERRMRHKDGSIIYVEANVKKCNEETVMAIARNVTERKRVKDELEKEKILSDSIIRTLPGIFFLRQVPGKVIRWNKNFEDVLGYLPYDIENMSFLALIAKEDKHRIGKKIEEALATGSADAEACIVKKNGEKVPYYFSAISIIYEGMPCIMGTAIDISSRVKAEKLLQEEKKKRQHEVTEAVITGAENERQAIGRELHDNINQLLAGVLMYIRLFLAQSSRSEPLLDEAIKQVNNAIGEIRSLSHSMISPFLQDSPFSEALEKITDVLRKSGIKNIVVDISGFEESLLSAKFKITLFRIIQEQFNNIMKHAGAKKVLLSLKPDQEKLVLLIKDDGIGFDPNEKSHGIGFTNIKTRASLFNGAVLINSSPAKGCTLKVVFNHPSSP